MKNIFKFLKKKPITEETVWVPPDKTISDHDELALCQACRFAGQCQFRDGCKMYRQTVENRQEIVNKTRGFKGKPYVPGGLRLNYMTGIGWRDRQDKYHFSQLRIVAIEGDMATVNVKFFEDGKRGSDVSKDLHIRIPTVTTEKGFTYVDMYKFRQEVKQQLAR